MHPKEMKNQTDPKTLPSTKSALTFEDLLMRSVHSALCEGSSRA